MTVSTLAELQDRFQTAILTGDDAVLADIVDSPRENRDILFGVYRNAYLMRLIEILENDYEMLSAYSGEVGFRALARAYVLTNPSRHSNARFYGEKLPRFLAETRPWSDTPAVPELAAIECALNDAFDDASAAPMTIGDLAAVPPDDWGALALRPQPFVHRLDLASNALDIWTALRNGETPPAPEDRDDRVHLLVYRHDLTSRLRPMDRDEAMMWDEMAKGLTFGVLCEMMATFWDAEMAPARAAGHLQAWITDGLLVHDVA
ncbi:hypothetical protein GGD81_000555 [Rhodobium orientis]|uniref:Putative DNA-binding domain-containing protein n=1 Tax=Rhodobium orientis TaxID=34017 RepID=A0A327JEG0_9HYPH|nr:DNA-binding domain-containing protein [Rhodobium orientis]MBB4301538.1 hypothetical protein [Rhodobium orientis]MBK5952235.1 hypothetical protein [Rhodobium orientis]RAI24820.1 hypothetical protein CH339_21030 [Rhodobium orientis]